MSRMTRCRIAAVVLLGTGLLTRITDRAGVPPKNPARADEKLPGTETVDLRNGNLHLEIPIRSTHQKTAPPRSATE